MDPRKIIRDASEDEEYTVTDHCLEEMDKDSISIEQIEHALQNGKIVKRSREQRRYTLKDQDIMICVAINQECYVTVITAGRGR